MTDQLHLGLPETDMMMKALERRLQNAPGACSTCRAAAIGIMHDMRERGDLRLFMAGDQTLNEAAMKVVLNLASYKMGNIATVTDDHIDAPLGVPEDMVAYAERFLGFVRQTEVAYDSVDDMLGGGVLMLRIGTVNLPDGGSSSGARHGKAPKWVADVLGELLRKGGA